LIKITIFISDGNCFHRKTGAIATWGSMKPPGNGLLFCLAMLLETLQSHEYMTGRILMVKKISRFKKITQ
jgi:hypothetical protein